jgi:arabinose-5-phosphate isomerase
MGTLEYLKRVFQQEIETLVNVKDSLDGAYTEAVEVLFRCSGKVVVAGVGKSGHIAQKIASTMVSTGTPAFFLHPSDAMHGDVGIINTGDVLLVISKSGESEELISILNYVRNIGVPAISITANPTSALQRNSDLVLLTPIGQEACPLNLAPTSSTTAALVVGDALAMALMKLRDFKPEDFAQFHPGGQLGKRLLMTVAHIMRSGEANPVIAAKDNIRNMLCEITGKRSGAVSVIDHDGFLLGLITDYDIRKVLEQGQDLLSMSIPNVMNSNPSYVFSDEKAVNTLRLMEDRERPFLVMPVLDRATEKVVGMVHLHDLVARGL